jgi:hypothetical protein
MQENNKKDTEQCTLHGVSGSLLEFEDDVNRMMELYKAHRYTQAEELRDELAERLDDIMRLGGNYLQQPV